MESSGLRERNITKDADVREATLEDTKPEQEHDYDEEVPTFSLLDMLRLLIGLILLNCSMSYFITNDTWLWGWRPWFLDQKQVIRYVRGPIHLTDAQLMAYDGSDPNLPVYLGLNGTIYDVTVGRRIYGPGGMYSILAGKDAARGFITGCFDEDGTPDLRDVEWMYVPVDVLFFEDDVGKVDKEMKTYRAEELRKAKKEVKKTIDGWADLFSGKKDKEYFEVGKIEREDGWLEKLPRRKLCEPAQKKRPPSRREG